MNAELIDRLGWTLLHSLWQLTLLALVLMLLLRLLQRSSAHSRYFCATLILLAMAVSSPLTFCLWQDRCTQISLREIDAETLPLVRYASTKDQALPAADRQTTNVGSATPTMALGREQQPASWRERFDEGVRPWLATLVGCWLAGVSLLSARPLAGWWAVRRLRRVGTLPVESSIEELTRRAARRVGVQQVVRVVQSTLVAVPATIGWLEPLILLPIGLTSGLTPLQLEAVLAHELAHIRRRDYLVNLLQTLAETLLFYHPAVWWVSHQMRIHREDCCDDLALAVCPSRRDYARTLVALDELRSLPAAAMSASGGSLLSRIRRILLQPGSHEPLRPRDRMFSSAWPGGVALGAIIVAIGLFASTPASPMRAAEPASAARDNGAPAENTETPPVRGTLVGRFVFDGPVPEPATIPIYRQLSQDESLRGVQPEQIGAVPDESLVVSRDGGLANVFIYVTSASARKDQPDEMAAATLRILDRRFQPRALAMQVSQKLVVENLDRDAANVHLQGMQNNLNQLIMPRSDRSLSLQPEKIPIRIRSDIQPWMQAFVLPHENRFHAVSQADGTFKLEGLPLGKWEFRVWHERCGYVNTQDWPRGRFALQIGPGRNELEAIKLSASLFAKPVEPARGNTPAARRSDAADPWFWPDPYSHLGHDDAKGEGWRYVRVAADDTAGDDLHTTAKQRKALLDIYGLFMERTRDLWKKLREEGSFTAAAWTAGQAELWLKAREAARPLLTDAQHQRVEQLVIQRQSYSVFHSADLTTRLELTDEQQTKIKATIAAHLQRIKDEELELERSTQASLSRGNEQHAEYVRKMTTEKNLRGRLSHRRVWDEIHDILTQQQREQFNRLRGPIPEATRAVLSQFEPPQRG